MGGAFAHNHGAKIPLVWSHNHGSPDSVLGHALLENRPEGVYAYGFFNNTENGQKARELVESGDLNSLSIFANQLVKQGNNVVHGQIREVSLVLSGANPGATIDKVSISHSSDGTEYMEAIICTNDVLMHNSSEDFEENEREEMPNNEDLTVQDVVDTMSDEQLAAMNILIEAAAEGELDDDEDFEEYDDEDFEEDDELEQSGMYDDYALEHSGDNYMTGNVFAQGGFSGGPAIDRAQIGEIIHSALESRADSLKDAFIAHAQSYGVENIDILFPDAQSLTGPQFLKRQTEWVTEVLEGVNKSPFARIKSIVADITADEARARGYIKGNEKKDEVLRLLKRETTPTTIYKKQALDRDDIIDITNMDVVMWLKGEMKLMLNEEIARAILFGDGRDFENPDKINESRLRPISKDVFPYTHTVVAVQSAGYKELVNTILRGIANFKGSGTPALFMKHSIVTELLLQDDKMGRYVYDDINKLTTKLGVSKIVRVPDQIFTALGDVFGVIVNLNDYTLGSAKQGETTLFEDFNLNFNKMQYLMETRLSGCLTKPESALILKWGETAGVVTPEPLTGSVIPEPKPTPKSPQV